MSSESESSDKKKTAWHQSPAFLIIAVLVVGPLAIPLIWINKKLSFLMKLLCTIAILALTAYLFSVTSRMVQDLQTQLKDLM